MGEEGQIHVQYQKWIQESSMLAQAPHYKFQGQSQVVVYHLMISQSEEIKGSAFSLVTHCSMTTCTCM